MLSGLLDISVLVFSVASMLSVGLGSTVQEMLGRLGSAPRVARALIANFVLVPILAYVIAYLFALDAPFRNGLMLLGMAAGAPFVIKLTEVARHDVGTAGTLLVLLLPVTVIYLPIVAPLVLPKVTVTISAIAVPLLLSMLLPLVVGLLTRAWLPRPAQYLQPVMGPIGTIALVVLIVLTFILNFQSIVGLLGTGAILAAAAFFVGAFAIGFLLGEDRGVLGLGTAQRNVAAATIVATQSIGDPDTLAMVVVASIVDLAILFPIAWYLETRADARVRDLYDSRLTGRG
ncbi:MAG: hypothetical protein KJZ80_18225 [Hyphomicrobiaceae bacterium]|nr:hypothetical protein [Hyphomicrobiaceae bacterium]